MANHGLASSDPMDDVFLSSTDGFGCVFTDHLYEALLNAGIKTFRDEKQQTAWDEIRSKIERSRMSIVVFCKDYPSSPRCLDELAKIVECYDNKTTQVYPIFYKLPPYVVRWQKKCYGEAMVTHEDEFGKDSEKVKSWKDALSKVGDLSGQHCTDDMYESDIIKKIAKDIYDKLPPMPLEIKRVVGFEPRFEELKQLMDLNSNDKVRMIGIYGPSGIGKTTFVAHMYNKIRDQFVAASFIGNITKKSKINYLEDLQTTLLSEMGEKTIKTMRGNTSDGGQEIQRKLGDKRVLLVLDDVHNIKQLEALAGADEWFGSGSRIVITTTERKLLGKHDVEIEKYEMKKLNEKESVELFCWHAFDKSQPEQDFAGIVARAVSFAKDVPGALEVIGSNLKGLSIDECEMELDKYENVPNAFPFSLNSF